MWGGGDGVLTWRPCLFSCRVLAVLVTWRSSDELVRVVSEGVSWRRRGTHLGPCGPSVGCCSRWRRREVWEGRRMRRGQWWWWWWEGRSDVAQLHAVSAFGRSRAAESVGGIYLLKSPFLAKLYCSVGLSARLGFFGLGFNSCIWQNSFFININKDTINIISNLLKVI